MSFNIAFCFWLLLLNTTLDGFATARLRVETGTATDRIRSKPGARAHLLAGSINASNNRPLTKNLAGQSTVSGLPFEKLAAGRPIADHEMGIQYCRFHINATMKGSSKAVNVTVHSFNRVFVVRSGNILLRGFLSATAMDHDAVSFVQLAGPLINRHRRMHANVKPPTSLWRSLELSLVHPHLGHSQAGHTMPASHHTHHLDSSSSNHQSYSRGTTASSGRWAHELYAYVYSAMLQKHVAAYLVQEAKEQAQAGGTSANINETTSAKIRKLLGLASQQDTGASPAGDMSEATTQHAHKRSTQGPRTTTASSDGSSSSSSSSSSSRDDNDSDAGLEQQPGITPNVMQHLEAKAHRDTMYELAHNETAGPLPRRLRLHLPAYRHGHRAAITAYVMAASLPQQLLAAQGLPAADQGAEAGAARVLRGMHAQFQPAAARDPASDSNAASHDAAASNADGALSAAQRAVLAARIVLRLSLQGAREDCMLDLHRMHTTNVLQPKGIFAQPLLPPPGPKPSDHPIILLQPPFNISTPDVVLALQHHVNHHQAMGFFCTMMYVRNARMHRELLEAPSIAALVARRALWLVQLNALPPPHAIFPPEYQRQTYSHAMLAFNGLPAWLLPVDLDEYLIAAKNATAFTIQDMMREHCMPKVASLTLRRINFACSKCSSGRELDDWPSLLGPSTSPLAFYDSADQHTYCRIKSFVNPNCMLSYNVHEGIKDKHTRGCTVHKVLPRQCGFLLHMRSLFAERSDGYNFLHTTEIQPFAAFMSEQIQAQALAAGRVLRQS